MTFAYSTTTNHSFFIEKFGGKKKHQIVTIVNFTSHIKQVDFTMPKLITSQINVGFFFRHWFQLRFWFGIGFRSGFKSVFGLV